MDLTYGDAIQIAMLAIMMVGARWEVMKKHTENVTRMVRLETKVNIIMHQMGLNGEDNNG